MKQRRFDTRALARLGASCCAAAVWWCGGAQAQPHRQRPAELDLSRPSSRVARLDPLDTLLQAVTIDGVREHQFALQQIADDHGGTRAAGTAGYDASALYVTERLNAAGIAVTQPEFTFNAYIPQGTSEVEQLRPLGESYTEGIDFNVVRNSDSGDVSAAVTAVDLRLDEPSLSTSGCEPEDFAAFARDTIALVQRGGCTFREKAENAAAFGAVGVVIFNQGDTPAKSGLLVASVSPNYSGGVPVFATSFEQGMAWSQVAGLRLRLFANVLRGPLPTHNVIAEIPGTVPGMVIMAGAHLDSVFDGPGINDNGSGSAALLAVAEQLAGLSLPHTVRLAWWGAEESGLLGSANYVANLPAGELARLGGYLNFDMIGSPNFVRFVLDGDGSAFGAAGPPGSAVIESAFEAFFASRGIAYEPALLSFRSDYAAFANAGVAVGGLFTGAEGVKSADQALTFGGVAGTPYDDCYHAACDTIDNVATDALAQNADAVASTLYLFASGRLQLPAPSKQRRYRPAKPHTSGCHDTVALF